MSILRIFLLISLIASFTCHSKDFDKRNTILVLGDSLSAAYGIELEQGWVNLLQNKLDINYSNDNSWHIINASVSGETTAGGLARLPGLLEEFKPTICMIELGANNGLRGQAITDIREHLDKMVQLCNQAGRTLLLGIRLPPNYGRKYTQEFDNSFNIIATKHDIPVVPFILEGIATEEKYFQADGIHPTAEAQSIILENIWPTLSTLLDSAQ